MRKWKILNESRIPTSLALRGASKNHESRIKDVTNIILKNREIKTKKEQEEFLNSKLSSVTTKSVGINKIQLKKAVNRIKRAIKNKEQIVVFGDYDVDGICGSAIVWETLNALGAKVMPYIPHRIDEGYGLSIRGIGNIKNQKSNLKNVGLIITVDNGIVANKAVDFAKKEGIDVIITDHHVPPAGGTKKLPKAFAIVHTVQLCGTGVAWMLSSVILTLSKTKGKNLKRSFASAQDDNRIKSHLELVALATVADLVPLKGANRTLLKFGLEELRKTRRPGLLELFKEAALDKNSIGVYEIGHIIAPRLNAMGRLEYAMDSLRLICTNNQKRAESLARLLGSTNKERQGLTLEAVMHAVSQVKSSKLKVKSLLFVQHESYEQGVIGLVAGKLVEEFYRPAIVVSIGEKYSKASARSISGFNIIEFIRAHSSLLVDAGGHPMAAGFTVETTKLLELQKSLEEKAEIILTEDLLTRSLKIDCELPLNFVDINLYESLQKLSPFGMGNPEPTFVSRDVVVNNIRTVGKENKHLKLQFVCHPEASAEGFHLPANALHRQVQAGILRYAQNDKRVIEGIGFGLGEMASKIHIGDKVDMAYVIDENEWPARRSFSEGGNGEKRLQLKLKDLKTRS